MFSELCSFFLCMLCMNSHSLNNERERERESVLENKCVHGMYMCMHPYAPCVLLG